MRCRPRSAVAAQQSEVAGNVKRLVSTENGGESRGDVESGMLGDAAGEVHPARGMALRTVACKFELAILDEKEMSPDSYFQVVLILQQNILQISAACSNADKS
ncbi:hypothetical protein AAES_05285 [Amazona aestiva]|uniref:Uncharacterized protein n=1 Tax=Amazona aestiva TaxID=12930 RepID=A0A0Q3U3K7_AMAAE|nr:hypothetical protein AAES_05285 [Amazona aestiva]